MMVPIDSTAHHHSGRGPVSWCLQYGLVQEWGALTNQMVASVASICVSDSLSLPPPLPPYIRTVSLDMPMLLFTWSNFCVSNPQMCGTGAAWPRFQQSKMGWIKWDISQCHPWDVILGLQDAKCQRNTLVSPFTILTVLGGCCSCSLVMEQFGMTNPNAWWLLIVTSATSMDWHQQPSKINEWIDRWR